MPAKGWVKQNGKREFIGIRITADEKKKLDYLCDKTGLNYTDFVREHINNYYNYFKKEVEK